MQKIFKLDWVILTVVFLLLLIGLLALYGVSLADTGTDLGNFKKQLISASIGIVLMFFVAFFDYRSLSFFSTKLYFATVFALGIVLFWGTKIRGTTGWIGVGFFHIQPVEMAKLAMVIFLASFFSRKKSQLSLAVRIIVSVILIFFPIFLIIKQPDFGSSMIIIASWAVMLSISGINKKNLFILFLIGILASCSSWFILKDYQKERLVNFVNPHNDPRGSGYNVIQSMVAVGSGGLMGKGLGHGSQSQLNFLPEKHTDFIFAVIAEELGFFGAAVVLTLLVFLFYRLKEIARLSSDNFGYLLAVGILVMIFSQAFINIGMNIGAMPVAGVPLPFLSYGGSSLVAMLISIGMTQSIYIHRVKAL
ncbi:MAG TPA: rod shape-determining protein RodA [Candidatus Moranbacteria bacterium]|nr:rod shape-determining protein RodA [Candidatus Moranbacteria bacterium]HAT74440.1 rod shape-determining protein RodA [Candidatus Moranbacteria bacterium]